MFDSRSANIPSIFLQTDDDDDTIVGNLKKMAYSNSKCAFCLCSAHTMTTPARKVGVTQRHYSKCFSSHSLHTASLASSDKSGISRPPLPSNRALQNIEPMPTAGGRTKNGNTIFKPTSIYLDGTIQNGEKILDIMVPGQKVGFIIGKGGDMIRQLQERANVKMTIIQQSSEVTDNQKQLRIVGDPNKVDIAQQLVKDLLVEKEMEMLKYKNKPDRNNHHNSHSNHSNHNSEYGGSMGGSNYLEIPVSPQFIGLVIGKSGENIKRISHETGAKVVVDVQKTDSTGNKLCQISAMNPNQLNMAAEMVRDILNNAMNNKRGGGRGGRDNDSMHAGGEEVKIQVPHNKTGIIIGKGGENIRALKQQCGCQIELEKNSKGIFYIRGSVDRVQYAQQVLSEKIGGNITVLSSTIQSNPQAAAAAAAAAYTDPYWAASQAQFAYPQMQPNAGAAAATNSGKFNSISCLSLSTCMGIRTGRTVFRIPSSSCVRTMRN